LRDLERACPIRIRMVLTDNGKEFTDRLFGLRKRAPTGKHEFDLLCSDLGTEHVGRDEQLCRAHFAGRGVNHVDRVPRVIDEQTLPRRPLGE